mgnify:CR=1 FL=1
MKKIYKYLLIFFLLAVIIGTHSHYMIKRPAPVFYIPWLPGSLMAQTIPPLGIFIEKAYKDEGDAPGSILAHEKVHWMQYQEMGLWNFYITYWSGLVKEGRLYNDMEKDARERSK